MYLCIARESGDVPVRLLFRVTAAMHVVESSFLSEGLLPMTNMRIDVLSLPSTVDGADPQRIRRDF